MPFHPRGRIVCPSRPVSIGAATTSGPLPGLIVRIRAGSGRLTREFHRFCTCHGLHARPVQASVEGRPDFFEVVGTVDGLERLVGHPAVVDFHYVLSTRVPVGSQGAGEVSDRVRRVINRQRLPKVERLAWEETERRAKLPKEEREDIELAEARARMAAL
jgi:hypothetical protein